MEKFRELLGFGEISDDWCVAVLGDDFCSSEWPLAWHYDKSLIGLEEHFENLLKFIWKKKEKVWDTTVLSDIVKVQCITNIVMESCIQNEGSILTGLYCGACYISITALKGSSARNVFHGLLFGKTLDLLKISDDSCLFRGVLYVFDALCELLISNQHLPDQCYWALVKSVLTTVTINSAHAKNGSFDNIFRAIICQKHHFKFFVKESSPYILTGRSFVADQCVSSITMFFSENRSIISHYVTLIQHLCVQISDRTEVRKQTEVYILKLLHHLPPDQLFNFVTWVVTDYGYSSKVVHRMFSVELYFQLSFLTKEKELLYQAIVSHLCDKAPTVRAKSLMVLSDLVKLSEGESIDPLLQSYFNEFDDEKNILSTFDLLSYDSKSSVRKSSCHLLYMILTKVKLRRSWLTVLYRLSLDTAVSVRKQALISVSQLLKKYFSNPIIQRLWLETILPSINDNENSLKDYCILQLRSVIDDLVSDEQWELLKLIANPRSTDLHVYFSLGMWNMTTNGYELPVPSKDAVLVKLAIPEFTPSALLIISRSTPQFASIPLLNIFQEASKVFSDEGYQVMILVLNCLKESVKIDNETITLLKSEIHKYVHPFCVIKELAATIARYGFYHSKDKFLEFCHEELREIREILESTCLNKTSEVSRSSKKLSCYLFTLGEIAQYLTDSIHPTITVSLKELIIDNIECSFSTSVRGQAIVTLGKICLGHEEIAKDAVVLLSRVLEQDTNCEVRNNILIVLSDLIVMYPTVVAEYLYCITDCLRDQSKVMRRQAIIILTKLLQEDYLKWRSGIVMKFLPNLVHDDIDIQQLCELCLTNVLLIRHPKTYFDYFIEFVFFANELFSFTTTTEPNLKQFSLPGPENEIKRRSIYSIMLMNLSDQQKLDVTTRVCKEILSMFIAENQETIEENMKPLLKDALWILCCHSLKLSSLRARSNNDFDEGDSNVGILNAQKKVISSIVKENFVEYCLPIIIALRQKLRKVKSPLQQHLMKFIVSFMKDYKNEIQVFFGGDTQFIVEIQYDVEEFNRAEDEIEGVREPVPNVLMTPGFLKMFNTPQTGRVLNLSIANGPGHLFKSPFFTAPTPFSATRKQARNIQSRRNLIINSPATSRGVTCEAAADTTISFGERRTIVNTSLCLVNRAEDDNSMQHKDLFNPKTVTLPNASSSSVEHTIEQLTSHSPAATPDIEKSHVVCRRATETVDKPSEPIDFGQLMKKKLWEWKKKKAEKCELAKTEVSKLFPEQSKILEGTAEDVNLGPIPFSKMIRQTRQKKTLNEPETHPDGRMPPNDPACVAIPFTKILHKTRHKDIQKAPFTAATITAPMSHKSNTDEPVPFSIMLQNARRMKSNELQPQKRKRSLSITNPSDELEGFIEDGFHEHNPNIISSTPVVNRDPEPFVSSTPVTTMHHEHRLNCDISSISSNTIDII